MRVSKKITLTAILAGAWLAGAVAGFAQTIPNPSFETDTFTVYPGYISGNTPITGWTGNPESNVGLNPAGTSPFANNGTVPDGLNVAFIQSSAGGSTLSTVISGLTVDKVYKLTFRANARATQAPVLHVLIDTEEILVDNVQAVTGSNPYWHVAREFTAKATEQLLTLMNDASGDTTVLVDDFKIAPSPGTWTVAPWTGDEDSGVNPNFLYTHAYNFGSLNNPVLNGIAFTGVVNYNPSVPGRFTSATLANFYANDPGNILVGASRILANDFLYGGAVPATTPQTIALQGLTPEKEYVITLFTVAWGDAAVPLRIATFAVGEDRMTINQEQLGGRSGMTISCRYMADTNGTAAIKFGPLQPANLSIHVYAFCNREAVAGDFAPGITFQPQNKILALGQPGSLSVVANGVPAPTYQWRHNSQNIADATNATLVIAPVAQDSGGAYDVVIANSAGATTSAVAQVTVGLAIANPSFEANTFDVTPGYISGNTEITGWTASNPDRAGLNPVSDGTAPFADNGVIPDGNNVAFIQSDEANPSSLSTQLSGLVAGTTYQIALRANARALQTPTLRVLVDDGTIRSELLALVVRPAPAIKPYWYFACEFTATAEEETLILLNDAIGDNTVLIDDVTVVPSNGAWKVAPWNNDADCGVDGNYPYTHAYHFGGTANFTVNGIPFTGMAGVNPYVANSFYTVHFPNEFTSADANNIAGSSKGIGTTFVYSGANVDNGWYEGLTLQGLTPGTEYVLTLYSAAWENANLEARWVTVAMGEDRLTVNQDMYNDNNGLTITHRYTADASGTATVKIAPVQPVNLSFHLYGFSNRKAVSPYTVPAVVNQPQYQFATVGKGVSFNVLVTGLPTPTFQWRHNGVNIDGATSNVLDLAQTASTDLGGYDVVIANLMGSVTSRVAQLMLGPDIVQNPSFEVDTYTVWPGYQSGNFPITAWTAQGGHGINPVADGGSPFADNGAIPDGRQVAFMQQEGSLSQVITGFEVGKQYLIHYFENARSGYAVPGVEVKVNGTSLLPAHAVTMVGGAAPYWSAVTEPFAPESAEAEVAFVKSTPFGGDATALIDEVAVIEILPGTAPWVILNPAPGLVVVGGSASFTAAGSGSMPLTYQWLKDGAPITGATNRTFSLSSIQKTAEADYSLLVSNSVGTATSTAARLSVNEPIPGLFNTGVDDNGATLANGAVDPHYVMIQNDDTGSPEAIVQDTTAWPIISGPWLLMNSISSWIGPRFNTSASLPGFYKYRLTLDLTGRDPKSVMLQGQWSTDNSGRDIFVNDVGTGLQNSAQFASWTTFVIYGTNVNFIEGTNTLDFYVENEAAVGPTGLRVEFTASNARTLPGVRPEVTKQPVSQTVAIGDSVTFTTAVKGASPFAFQWKKDGVPLAGQDTLTLTLANVTTADSGLYTFEVSNSAGTATSEPADLCVCLQLIPGIFGTGVDADGMVIMQPGTVDPHYVMVASADAGFPGPDAVRLNETWPIAPTGPWIANGPKSVWIGPQPDQQTGSAEGNYTYETTFDLTGYDLSQVTVVGAWSVDNTGLDILVNGNSTGLQNTAQFVVWTPFTLTAANGLQDGMNILDFIVNNAPATPNPTGLRVDLRGVVPIQRGVRLAISVTGNTAKVSWTPVAADQKLQSAPTVKGPWTDVTGAASPYSATVAPGSMMFFRVVSP
jgi:hypothetical protein